MGGSGRRLAIVDEGLLVAFGQVNHHESTAADIAGARVGHPQCEARGDCGVHRVAPLAQNLDADFGDQFLRARHHAIGGNGGQETVLEVQDRFLTLGGNDPDNQE